MKQGIIHTVARATVLFLYRFVEPSSMSEDLRRREFLANVILLGCIIFLLVGAISALIYFLYDPISYNGLHPGIFFIITIVFWMLYVLARSGFLTISAYILVGITFLGTTYSIYVWGADLPQALLSYALVITIAGVLIHTRFAVLMTLLIGVVLGGLSYLQIQNIISIDTYWKYQIFDMGDAVVTIVTFGVIAVLSWLSNREVYRSLHRAQRSEKLLAEERDLLEVRVIERTQELEKVQIEKTVQLYRFAEFGRMASGLFHDMVNPLTSVALNLELMKIGTAGPEEQKENLENALVNLGSMQKYVEASRKQIQNQDVLSLFLLSNEIELVIKMLSFKARDLNVEIEYKPYGEIELYGNAIKFYRLITGLLANAVEAYDEYGTECRKVTVGLSEIEGNVHLTIEDFGCGISSDCLTKIFQPLFTTKSTEKGTGIGLMICKEIVEKDFGGTIAVSSEKGRGTTFFITLPKKKPEQLLVHEQSARISTASPLASQTTTK